MDILVKVILQLLFNKLEDYDAGYPTVKGQVLNGQQLWELIEGLEGNELLFYTHLLTGIVSTTLCIFYCELYVTYLMDSILNR